MYVKHLYSLKKNKGNPCVPHLEVKKWKTPSGIPCVPLPVESLSVPTHINYCPRFSVMSVPFLSFTT